MTTKSPFDFPPTAEQAFAIDQFLAGGNLVIQAGAGAGKTSTLLRIAHAADGLGQYIAYNAPIVRESRSKFPKNVACNTAHSLARAAVGKPFEARLNNPRKVLPMAAATILGINPMMVTDFIGEKRQIGAGFLAAHVLRGVKAFCQSSDTEMTVRHLPLIEGLDEPLHMQRGLSKYPINDAVSKAMLPFMQKAWKDICMYQGALQYTHDYYLKLWHLSGAHIAADFILFDEAQDANPVIADIVLAQTHAQLVFVGDSQQSIYGFTGAVDALAKLPADNTAFLTQSFRFGPAIAEVANSILEDLQAELRIVGTESKPSVVEATDEPDAILCRTNAGAIRTMLEAQKEGKSVHLVGGSTSIQKFAKGAKALMAGERTDHPELACFGSWQEVLDYVDEDEDGGDLRLLVALIEEFTVETILSALDNESTEEDADLVVTTGHKSKGREWDKVRLGPDFKTRERIQGEELRLLYVCATRARLVLDITLCPAFNDDLEDLSTKPIERKSKTVKASEYVGTVGDIEELSLTITAINEFDGKYGLTNMIKLVDADGNTYAWMTKRDFVVGEVLDGEWEIKAHRTWRGVKETTVKLERSTVPTQA